jgi:hypothetical protein
MKTVCVSSVPLLNGYMLQSDDQEEVLTILDEAKALGLETALEEWIPILKPTGVTSL